MGGVFARTPREHSDAPLPGYKLAYPMVSADGANCAFSGVTLGRAHVYRVIDDAICAHGSRHAPPSRWCDCGFYCFHDIQAARDLACEPDHRSAVLLEVAVSGRYRRYERGLRYSRQRVRTVRLGRCECGRPAALFADSGAGSVGWRKLIPVCPTCAATRPVLTPDDFARRAGKIEVLVEAPVQTGPAEPDGPGTVAILAAEVALLQARLDDVQARLDALTRPPGAG